jgi:hypothetical protein
VAPVSGTADFFVVMTSSGGKTKVEAAKYITGEEKLKALTANLLAAKVDFSFPDDVPTKILRRGVLSCGSTALQRRDHSLVSDEPGECEFVMMLPEDVHSVD